MATPLHGQVSVTITAQPLSATPVSPAAYTIKAPASNANPVYLGASTVTPSTGHQLDPGDSVDYQRTDQHGQAPMRLNPSDFYVVGTSGDKVTWVGSP